MKRAAFFITLSLAATLFTFQNFSNVTIAEKSKVDWTSLSSELKGAAVGTTGGLEKPIYKVNSLADDDTVNGTLRYGVNKFAKDNGGAWIVFDKQIFPPDKITNLYLSSQLNFTDRPNITIDGRGSHVLIRRKYYWEDADFHLASTGVYECDPVKSPQHPMGPILSLRRSKNVIVTHVEFYQQIIATPEHPEPYPDLEKDTQCFGDIIAIGNTPEDVANKDYFDKIWINHSTFQRCGDECISVTHASSAHTSAITISNSYFKNSYKSMIIGGWYDAPLQTSISIYGNRFVKTKERSPRVMNQFAHVFNNAFENYNAYNVGVMGDAKVISENNIFLTGDNTDPHASAIKRVKQLKDLSGKLITYSNNNSWHKGNLLDGATLPSQYVSDLKWPTTAEFPIYNPNLAQPIPTPQRALLNSIRAGAGWVNAPNPAQ